MLLLRIIPFMAAAVVAVDPSYEALRSQLPVAVAPGGKDQFLFFIVPVQKDSDTELLLQVAQVQDNASTGNTSVNLMQVEVHDGHINTTYKSGPNLTLQEAFDVRPSVVDFNYQVPVVVPMDFTFSVDPEDPALDLPVCGSDTRTWREHIVTRVVSTMNIAYHGTWDTSGLIKKLRLKKDILTTVKEEDLTSAELVDEYVGAIVEAKTLADVKSASLLQDLTTLTTSHLGMVGEGVDTYKLLLASIGVVERSAIASNTTLDQLAAIKDSSAVTLELYESAFIMLKGVQVEASAP